jgi:protein phosphatase
LVTWFEEHINPDDLFTDDKFREALEYAYQQLDKYADGNPKQMGTTLTLLYIHKQGVTAAHIGDSRIYHIRPEVGVLYLSRDHSLVFDLFQAGEITYEEMATFPQKNMVTRAMTPGENNRMRPDIIHITDILPDDYFYMCSDGMLERMDNDQLVALLSSQLTDEEKRNKLIGFTKCNQDNHSAWIIHIKDVITEEGDDKLVNEESTARCNVINIIPQVVVEDGGEVVDEDNNDVVIVKEAPNKLSFYKRIQNLFSFIKNKKK